VSCKKQSPSPNLMGAGLTRSISNVALMVMGNSLALDNPPICVAEEFAMLNVLNGGRLIASPDEPLVWRENLVRALSLVPMPWRRGD
jgi:hypothetical protein